jgi:carbonic anhydrase
MVFSFEPPSESIVFLFYIITIKNMHKPSFKIIVIIILTITFPSVACKTFGQAHSTGDISGTAGMKLLKEGNIRFVNGKNRSVDYVEERKELEKSQHPYAIILCCSDSRVPPERVFDESLGKLFVVRIAGNIVDSSAIGSIEYAAEHLGAHLIVVLGHESCGAVKATVEDAGDSPSIKFITRKIKPAADHERQSSETSRPLLDRVIEENVREQMNNLLAQSPLLQSMAANKSIQISGGVYQLGTGGIHWLQ